MDIITVIILLILVVFVIVLIIWVSKRISIRVEPKNKLREERQMENGKNSQKGLYKLAYDYHYKKCDPDEALLIYREIINDYPDSPEAEYSKQQINNIIGTNKLEEIHLEEIKQLLKEHESLTQIQKKIQGWTEEGYNTDELEKMIDAVKQPTVKKQQKAKEDLIDKEKNNYCPKCGSNIEGNPKFCKDCGTEL